MDNKELINLYFDNNLCENQRIEFNELLISDIEFKKDFELYSLAVQSVKNIQLYSPSDKFTDSLMNKLRIVSNNNDNRFFKIIISGLVILIIFILALIINYSTNNQSTTSIINLEILKNSKFKSFIDFWQSENALIILSSVTLFLLIGIYFIQNSFNRLKKQLI